VTHVAGFSIGEKGNLKTFMKSLNVGHYFSAYIGMKLLKILCEVQDLSALEAELVHAHVCKAEEERRASPWVF